MSVKSRPFRLLSAFTLLGMLSTAAVSSQGSIGEEDHHGSLCNPVAETDLQKLSLDVWGAANTSTSGVANVICGASLADYSDDLEFVIFNVFDRHATQDVCCTGYVQNSAGEVLASNSECSSGFESGRIQLQLELPGIDQNYFNLKCSIPPRTSNGISHVSTFEVFWLGF
jgi:hypothetical protein